jgi:DNA-binding CsgD family transcriptional regulator
MDTGGNLHEAKRSGVRTKEIDYLIASLSLLRQGRARIIEVAGAAGSGKTHALDRLERHARNSGIHTIRHNCGHIPRTGTLQLASAIFGTQINLGQTTPAATLEALYARAGNGLLLIVDDFHCADPETVEILRTVAEDHFDLPLLLVIGLRSRQASLGLRSVLAQCTRLEALDRVELGPLSPLESAILLGLPPGGARSHQLHRESGGNPFSLLALAADGHTTGVADEQLEGVTSTFLTEIARLDPVDSNLLAAAAVLGAECDTEALSAVAEAGSRVTTEGTRRLIQLDLLRPQNGGVRLVLRQPVLGKLIRRNIEPTWLAAAHHRAWRVVAARGASAAQQAVHIEHCLDNNAQLAETLIEAGEEKLWSDPVSAARWLELARQLPLHQQPIALQIRSSLLLAKAWGLCGRLPESRELLHSVLAGIPAGSPADRTSAVVSCALTEFSLGQYSEARALLTAELINADRASRYDADLSIALALVDATTGSSCAQDHISLALAASDGHQNEAWRASALALQGLSRLYTDKPARAEEAINEASATFDRLDDVSLEPFIPHMAVLSWAELYLGRFRDAERHTLRAIAQTQRTGQNYVLPVLLSCLSGVQRRIGSAVEAQQTAREARQAAERFHTRPLHGVAVTAEALSTAQVSSLGGTDALLLAEEATEALPSGVTRWSNNAIFALGYTALLAGDPVRTIAVLSDVCGGPDLPGVMPIMRPMWFETLTAAAVDAKHKNAAHWARQATRAACELGADLPIAYAEAAQAHILRSAGRHGEASKTYQHAAERFNTADLGYDRAQMLLHAGRCAALDRSSETAATLLSLAKEVARRHQAFRLHKEAEAEEQGLKTTPPVTAKYSTPVSWVGELTAREVEIARIAGTGKRTREIANELSLSPRTVDVHLANIYRKLKVNSRAALVRLVISTAAR